MNDKNKYNYDDMKKCFENKGYELLEEEYRNMHAKIKYICNKHKELGVQETNFEQALSYNKQCKLCKAEDIKERIDKERQKKVPLYVQKCKDRNYEYIGYIIKDNEMWIKYICEEHKTKGVQLIRASHFADGIGCPYCAHKKITIEDLKNDGRIQGVEILGEYVRNDVKIKCKCLKCNRIIYITPNHLKRGEGCRYCKLSKGEKKIEKYLIDNNIKYFTQYKFDDCRMINPLRFDFYLPDYNICIEYNGKQHYKSVKHFGGTENFERQQQRDNVKRVYCQNNNIKLVEIPYTEFNNIENLLNNILISVETAGN